MFGHDHHDEDEQNDNNTMVTTSDEPAADASLDAGGGATDNQVGSAPTVTVPASTTDNDTNKIVVTTPTGPANDDLLSIKQQALQQLSPLVSHLDQTPEEKFRTTMMMIQASDNQDLVKDAFEAAKQISDEKGRAQALLDIVNEINYFTQPDEKKIKD